MKAKEIIPDDHYHIFFNEYRNKKIYRLWEHLNKIDKLIAEFISRDAPLEYSFHIPNLLERSLVIIDIIQSRSLEERLSFLKQLKEIKENSSCDNPAEQDSYEQFILKQIDYYKKTAL